MRLLVITNLYPPQELGGYGRSMADFVGGLQRRGHQVQVVCSDATYLGPPAGTGESGEAIHRCLQLKGSFQGGVSLMEEPLSLEAINRHNNHCLLRLLSAGPWDGILLGNIDLLGPELLGPLLQSGRPVVHHVGFMLPPYEPRHYPRLGRYTLVAASQAVRASLAANGLPVAQAPVVYPGARVELFGPAATGHRALQVGQPLGSTSNPLRVAFAGLLMGSKGAHTLVEALIQLHRDGIAVQALMAGAAFQPGYREILEKQLQQAGLADVVRFVGQLTRPQLARMLALHQVGVFPSIFPEAFGIVGAEIQASGLALVSSGVGGAAELVDDGVSGLLFEAGNALSLQRALRRLVDEPGLLERLAQAGETRCRTLFSVEHSCSQLEQLF
jgi:glycosyltransferase involved in cell wall biosynthesis